MVLVDWLNKKRTDPKRKEVLGVLDRIQAMMRTAIPTEARFRITREGQFERRGRLFVPPGTRERITYKRGHYHMPYPEREAINQKLKRYKVYPVLFMQIEEALIVTWESANRAATMVDLIVRLAQAGYVLRVRRCKECEKWFFARFNHQLFCSQKCRQKDFRQSEKGKQRRADYMRNYMRNYRYSK